MFKNILIFLVFFYIFYLRWSDDYVANVALSIWNPKIPSVRPKSAFFLVKKGQIPMESVPWTLKWVWINTY